MPSIEELQARIEETQKELYNEVCRAFTPGVRISWAGKRWTQYGHVISVEPFWWDITIHVHNTRSGCDVRISLERKPKVLERQEG